MQYLKLKKKLYSRKYTWLITGVSGFIGSNLLNELLNLNQKVVGVDNFSNSSVNNLKLIRKSISKKLWKNFQFIKGDLCNLNICKKAIKNVDIVLHQAARGSIPKSTLDPVSSNNDNVVAFLNILSASKDKNIKSFVYASSSSVYGDSKKLPKVERNTGNVLSNYALTKKVNEEYASLFYRLYNFKTIGLRYFNVFGKMQNPNGDYAAVIPKWINKISNNKKIIVYGDGETSRDFCHIDNVVQANILAGLNNLKKNNYIFNVGTGNRITLNHLYKNIYKILKIDKRQMKIYYKDFRTGDIRHSLSSIRKIKRILKYNPNISFEKGLIKTIQWFNSN